MPSILRSYLGQRTTSSSHFTQVFIGDRSFIFVLPVIRIYSILSICSYVTRLISGIGAGIKDTEKNTVEPPPTATSPQRPLFFWPGGQSISSCLNLSTTVTATKARPQLPK